MDIEQFMADDPLLATCPGLLEHVQYVALRADETIVHAGQKVRHVFYVVSGEVRLVRRSRAGTEVVLQRCRQGFFSEASLTVSQYHCDVLVAEECGLLRFQVEPFRQALDENNLFRNQWMARITRELRKVRAQCERLSLHSAADRIVHYIESEGNEGVIELVQTRKSWALELGLTHEALYRTLKRLQDEGVLAIDKSRIHLIEMFKK